MSENSFRSSSSQRGRKKSFGLGLLQRLLPARRGEALVTPNLNHEEHIETDPPHAADVPSDEPDSFSPVKR